MDTNKHPDSLSLEYRFFLIDDRPYCLWGTDIQKQTLEFLNSWETKYFDHIAKTNISSALSTRYKRKAQLSSLTIRMTYSQALETLFALLAATIQAPQCIPAWMVTYKKKDLDSIVSKIHNGRSLTSLLKKATPSWSDISEAIHFSLVLEDKEKEAKIKTIFAQLWSRFASDYLNQDFMREYNSIKHGLRVHSSGFYVALGKEDAPGIPGPKANMQMAGKSNWGSSFFIAEKYETGNHHLQLKRHYRNWNPEDFTWGIHFISLSITNIISSLKILNGVHATKVNFEWPSDFSMLDEPWNRTKKIGVTSKSGFDTNIPEDFINPYSKEDIFDKYRRGEDAGIKDIILSSQNENE